VISQALAFVRSQLSWLLYVIRPAWSYRLNAHFEVQAEHEYALLVEAHHDWESEPFENDFVADVARLDLLPDLFRRISDNERVLIEKCLCQMTQPRLS
jgi:hypothetical protein